MSSLVSRRSRMTRAIARAAQLSNFSRWAQVGFQVWAHQRADVQMARASKATRRRRGNHGAVRMARHCSNLPCALLMRSCIAGPALPVMSTTVPTYVSVASHSMLWPSTSMHVPGKGGVAVQWVLSAPTPRPIVRNSPMRSLHMPSRMLGLRAMRTRSSA